MFSIPTGTSPEEPYTLQIRLWFFAIVSVTLKTERIPEHCEDFQSAQFVDRARVPHGAPAKLSG